MVPFGPHFHFKKACGGKDGTLLAQMIARGVLDTGIGGEEP